MRNRFLAFGLALLVGCAPAVAQVSQASDQGNSAGARNEAKDRQRDQKPLGNKGISLAVPVGRVSVGPDFPEGAPVYVRRTTVREGMTVVEVSTTPFMPVLASNEKAPVVRPDQPASW